MRRRHALARAVALARAPSARRRLMLVRRRARGRSAPARGLWWAVWDGDPVAGGRLRARTWRGARVERRRGARRVARRRCGRARASRRRAGRGRRPHGADTWTRKTRGVAVRGLDRARPRIASTLPALLDESAGCHARRTSWLWSAGAGVAASGAAVAWNLVDGLHDGRAVRAHGVGRRRAARDRRRSRSTGWRGVGDLRFTREAPRARRENLWSSPPTTSSRSARFAGDAAGRGRARLGLGRDGAPRGALVAARRSRARRAGRGARRGGRARPPRARGARRARRRGGAARSPACSRGATRGTRRRLGADARRARRAARARRRVRAGGAVRRARGAHGRGRARLGRAAARARVRAPPPR